MNDEEDDDSLEGEYPYASLSQLDQNMENNNNSKIPVLGCFHLLLQGFMSCVLEAKTICGDTINRRRHRNYDYYYTDAEAKVSLLTEVMEEDAVYPAEQIVPTTPQQVENLDQAMRNFVETNDSQALLQIFEAATTSAIKDDKQD